MTRVYCSTISPGLEILHGILLSGDAIWRPPDTLGGAGSQQMPMHHLAEGEKEKFIKIWKARSKGFWRTSKVQSHIITIVIN